jgi:hypothetical protein
MHRYVLALLIVAFPFSAFAAELPKEGSYDFNSCWSGIATNVITFSMTHTLISRLTSSLQILPRSKTPTAGRAWLITATRAVGYRPLCFA